MLVGFVIVRGGFVIPMGRVVAEILTGPIVVVGMAGLIAGSVLVK